MDDDDGDKEEEEEEEVYNTGRFTLSRARRNSQLHEQEDLPGDVGRLTLISKPLRARVVVGRVEYGRGVGEKM